MKALYALYAKYAKYANVPVEKRTLVDTDVLNLIYIYIYFYYFCKICTDITPTNSRAEWEGFMKAWNYITIDCHQEMDQEYSSIVQMIVKADRGKAIAWR